MSLLDIVFFALLGFFAWRGYVNGFWESASRLLGWALAYPAAIMFTRPLGDLLELHTPLRGLLAYFVAGSAVFLLVSFIASLVFKWLGQLVPANNFTERAGKFSGLALGLVIGGLLGLVVIYVLNLAPKTMALVATNLNQNTQADTPQTSANTAAKTPAPTGLPSIAQLQQQKDSFIAASAKKLISTAAAEAVELTLKDTTATQVTRAFVADPPSMLGHVQALTQDGEVRSLLENPQIQTLLNREDIQGLMQSEEFKTLVANPHMQALMQETDVHSEQGAQAAAEKLTLAWNRAQQLKHDPRVTAILRDAEFQQQLNSANKLPLLMNPKLKQLTEIFFSPAEQYAVRDLDQVPDRGSAIIETTSQTSDGKTVPTQIYRWTDAAGRVHYSDKPAPDEE